MPARIGLVPASVTLALPCISLGMGSTEGQATRPAGGVLVTAVVAGLLLVLFGRRLTTGLTEGALQ